MTDVRKVTNLGLTCDLSKKLKELFSILKRFLLVASHKLHFAFFLDNFAEEIALRLDRRLFQEINSIIVDWHNYAYDQRIPFNAITDGGDDMYDTGNQVSLTVFEISL